jgi:hypothetical protein
MTIPYDVCGLLKPESSFRSIFPDGFVPLQNPRAVFSQRMQSPVFLLDSLDLDTDTIQSIADFFKTDYQGDRLQVLDLIMLGLFLPIDWFDETYSSRFQDTIGAAKTLQGVHRVFSRSEWSTTMRELEDVNSNK